VTYNLDPDLWLESHRAALAARRDRGEIDDAEYESKFLELDRRYQEMVARLDGTYEIPAGKPEPDE
jgi:hypothetical protein